MLDFKKQMPSDIAVHCEDEKETLIFPPAQQTIHVSDSLTQTAVYKMREKKNELQAAFPTFYFSRPLANLMQVDNSHDP